MGGLLNSRHYVGVGCLLVELGNCEDLCSSRGNETNEFLQSGRRSVMNSGESTVPGGIGECAFIYGEEAVREAIEFGAYCE